MRVSALFDCAEFDALKIAQKKGKIFLWLYMPRSSDKNHRKLSMKHPVDIYVGKRMRQRRWLSGTTQQYLANQVGIKFQQIQKYETGMNRVSASRLWDIARALGVEVGFFFEGLESNSIDKDISGMPSDILSDKEALELLRSYYAIPENQRRSLFDLACVLSEAV